MSTVWKYPLPWPCDKVSLEMPRGAEILCLQVQWDMPAIWARVNPENEKETRTFMLFGTDWGMPPVGPYIGTFQLHGGRLVFHVFEATP